MITFKQGVPKGSRTVKRKTVGSVATVNSKSVMQTKEKYEIFLLKLKKNRYFVYNFNRFNMRKCTLDYLNQNRKLKKERLNNKRINTAY